VPEEWLQADIKQGISNSDVEHRRKRFGWNEITTEKENMFIKFLMFFTGPILYGESPAASHPLPMNFASVLRAQWLVAAFVFAFRQLLPASSSYGRKRLGLHLRSPAAHSGEMAMS
jgi:magnesium-transporting ATPase (P-type)